jgi:hypothetical protein
VNILARSAPSSSSPLGIKVSNSEPAPSARFRAPLPSPAPTGSDVGLFGPTELTQRLRAFQATSQAQRCGSWIGGKASGMAGWASWVLRPAAKVPGVPAAGLA